jgi:hypothetical protein
MAAAATDNTGCQRFKTHVPNDGESSSGGYETGIRKG